MKSVQVQPFDEENGYLVRIDFNPTVPHCSLASRYWPLPERGKILLRRKKIKDNKFPQGILYSIP
jgi:hypothetical protein